MQLTFPDPKNLRNKKKIMVLALIVPEIGKVNCTVTRDLDVLSRTRSRANSTRLFCYAIDFPDPKNLRNKKKIMVLALIVPEIGKVNCIVTWPWCTVTHKVTRKFYASMCYAIDFLDPKNLRNKKKIMVLALIVPEIGKVNCIVTWPWRTVTYKVTRNLYASICYAIDFPDPKNLRNKKKVMVLAHIVPTI